MYAREPSVGSLADKMNKTHDGNEVKKSFPAGLLGVAAERADAQGKANESTENLNATSVGQLSTSVSGIFYLLGGKCNRPGYIGISDVFQPINLLESL
jgi:hypothetical protein